MASLPVINGCSHDIIFNKLLGDLRQYANAVHYWYSRETLLHHFGYYTHICVPASAQASHRCAHKACKRSLQNFNTNTLYNLLWSFTQKRLTATAQLLQIRAQLPAIAQLRKDPDLRESMVECGSVRGGSCWPQKTFLSIWKAFVMKLL